MTATPTRPRLLFFFEPTAGASRRVEAFLAQILQRRRNHETFAVTRIDVSARPDLALRFRVNATPTVYVVDGNKVVGKVVRPRSTLDLVKVMDPWLR